MEKKPVLMVTDDDSDDLFLFEEALKSVDSEIHLITANDGKQALEKLYGMTDLPDLLFLDINMPGMNGWECLTRIKEDERLKILPVIMYSTSNNQRDIDKAFELQAFCFCTKPDDFKSLVRMLTLVKDHIHKDLEKALRSCSECNSLYFPGQ